MRTGNHQLLLCFGVRQAHSFNRPRRSCADISGEIIVVSDGSTDNTVAIVRSYADRGVRLLEIPQKVGKAEALSCGAALARNEILVFADVRQRWADDALQRMLENFADPDGGGRVR
jgi:glycosyltransferase involved in cell wall biosynthesis